jgi:hypothetical protein
MVSITVCPPERSDIKYTGMPSPVYQNMINLIVSLSIRRCPSKFMNDTPWEHRTFDNQIFGYDKVYYPNSIIITTFV